MSVASRAFEHVGTVTPALGVDPVWDDREVWAGLILADRARGWGWAPAVGLADALAELEEGVRAL